jgi:hypothetical protein
LVVFENGIETLGFPLVSLVSTEVLTSLMLSPESRQNDDRPRDNNDDVTLTDTSKEDDMSMRKSYLEAVLQ